jgi:hypothetical protein
MVMLTLSPTADEKNYKFMSSDAMEESFHEDMDGGEESMSETN